MDIAAMHIERLTPERFAASREALAELLHDAVEGGASVNFVNPFSKSDALAYWSKLDESVASGERIILAGWEGDALVGSVTLALATQPNGRIAQRYRNCWCIAAPEGAVTAKR